MIKKNLTFVPPSHPFLSRSEALKVYIKKKIQTEKNNNSKGLVGKTRVGIITDKGRNNTALERGYVGFYGVTSGQLSLWT